MKIKLNKNTYNNCHYCSNYYYNYRHNNIYKYSQKINNDRFTSYIKNNNYKKA